MLWILLRNVFRVALIMIVVVSSLVHAAQPAAASAAQAAGMPALAQSLCNSDKKAFDEKSHAQLIAKVGKNVGRCVGHNVLSRTEGLVYRYREALLPAVITVRNNNVNLIRQMIQGRTELVAQRYRRVQQAARLMQKRAVMTVAQDADESDDESNPINNQLLSFDDYKKLLGKEIVANTFVVIGYSDGSHEIKLSRTDLNKLKELSEEQIEFITSLYGIPDSDNPIILNEKEIKIFLSLNAGFRSALKHNYRLDISPALEGGEFAVKCKQESEALEKTMKEKTEVAAQIEHYNKELIEARKKLEELKNRIAHPHRAIEQDIEKKKSEYEKMQRACNLVNQQVINGQKEAQEWRSSVVALCQEAWQRRQELKKMENDTSWAACLWGYTSPILSLIGICSLALMVDERYRNETITLMKACTIHIHKNMHRFVSKSWWLRS